MLKRNNLVGAAGIEPATLGLEIRCSIRLSYGPSRLRLSKNYHKNGPLLAPAAGFPGCEEAAPVGML